MNQPWHYHLYLPVGEVDSVFSYFLSSAARVPVGSELFIFIIYETCFSRVKRPKGIVWMKIEEKWNNQSAGKAFPINFLDSRYFPSI